MVIESFNVLVTVIADLLDDKTKEHVVYVGRKFGTYRGVSMNLVAILRVQSFAFGCRSSFQGCGCGTEDLWESSWCS